MRQGGRAESKAAGKGGTEVDIVEGLSGIWRSFRECDTVKISREGNDGRRRRLASSGRQPA